MVTYGPWVQDRDYEEFRTITTNQPPRLFVQETAEVHVESGYQDPAYAITEGDLADALLAAHEGLPETGGWVESLASGYQLSFPLWNATWAAKAWYRSFPLTGTEHFYNPPNFGVPIPEGAIGLDYEGQPYDPDDPWASSKSSVLALHLGNETELEGRFDDGRVSGEEPLPWTVDTQLVLKTGAGSGATLKTLPSHPYSTANWIPLVLDETIDLTPFGGNTALEDDFSFSLHTETPTAIVGGDPSPHNFTSTQYGWLLKRVRLEAALRPPLYRWVYDGEPIRRTYPRDDGLAGGAPRTYPPSRALQSSNRLGGGYL